MSHFILIKFLSHSDSFIRKIIPIFYQVEHESCLEFKITVHRGEGITKGSYFQDYSEYLLHYFENE